MENWPAVGQLLPGRQAVAKLLMLCLLPASKKIDCHSCLPVQVARFENIVGSGPARGQGGASRLRNQGRTEAALQSSAGPRRLRDGTIHT
jgi:hypothetical protein